MGHSATGLGFATDHKGRIKGIFMGTPDVHCLLYVFYSIDSYATKGLAVAPHFPPLLGPVFSYAKLWAPEVAQHRGPNLRANDDEKQRAARTCFFPTDEHKCIHHYLILDRQVLDE